MALIQGKTNSFQHWEILSDIFASVNVEFHIKKWMQIFQNLRDFRTSFWGIFQKKTPSMLKAAQEEIFLLNSTYKPYQGSI